MLDDLLGRVFDRPEEKADARLERGCGALERRPLLLRGSGLAGWVVQAPVDRLRRARELGTDLAHAVAKADHVVEPQGPELAEVLRTAAREIDPALAHDLHSRGMEWL